MNNSDDSSANRVDRVIVLHHDDRVWQQASAAAAAEQALTLRCDDTRVCLALLAEKVPTCAVIEPTYASTSDELLRFLCENFFTTDIVMVGDLPPGVDRIAALSQVLQPLPMIDELRLAIRQGIATARQRCEDDKLIEDFNRRLRDLSPEERGVLEAVCEGKLNKQIAREYNVSVRTVEQRRRRVFLKFDIPAAAPLAAKWATVRTLQRMRRKSDDHGPRP